MHMLARRSATQERANELRCTGVNKQSVATSIAATQHIRESLTNIYIDINQEYIDGNAVLEPCDSSKIGMFLYYCVKKGIRVNV